MDLSCELLDDSERIAGQSGAAGGLVFVQESQRVVGLNAIGEVGIAGSGQNQVALEASLLVNFAGVKNSGVEAIILTETSQQCAFSENLRGGRWHKQLVGIMRVDCGSGIQCVEH